MKKHYLCSRFCERAKFLAKWCNGSTTDSGSVCLGSSPSLATKKKKLLLGLLLFFVVMRDMIIYPIAPLTEITCPDTYEERSDAKNNATLATSSASPQRRIGTILTISCLTSSGNAKVISVRINPGAIALARMLRAPSSLLRDLIKPMMPALDAA